MQRLFTIAKNEDGAMLIMASVMILILLTIISISASRTANTEIQIASNEYFYQKNFYCAEGAAIETIDRMEQLVSLDTKDHDWLMNETEDVDNDSNLFGFWNLNDDEREDSDAIPEASSVCSSHAELMSVHNGVLSGSSLDMSKPTKHVFSIYGQSNDRGLAMIKVGYTKAY